MVEVPLDEGDGDAQAWLRAAGTIDDLDAAFVVVAPAP